MLALLGALKGEIQDIRRHIVLEEALADFGRPAYKGRYKGKEVVLAQSGIGKARAEQAARFLAERYPAEAIISFGFGGALQKDLKAGDVLLCATLHCGQEVKQDEAESRTPSHSDGRLLSLASQALESTGARFRQGGCVTVERPVLKPEDKEALGRASGADVVDMESYWVARVASERKIPFLALRAVSDAVQDRLPPLDRLLDSEGNWRWEKATPYFLVHPKSLVELFALYRSARRARKSLTASVDSIIALLPP